MRSMSAARRSRSRAATANAPPSTSPSTSASSCSGQTTKKKPDYFGLDVGQIPGSTSKPAASDGKYKGGVVAIDFGGKSYTVRGDALKITLSGNRTKGTLSGTLLFGGSGPLTGTFSC